MSKDPTDASALHGGFENQVPASLGVRSPVQELQPPARGEEHQFLRDTLVGWGMTKDVATGDLYWNEVANDFGIEGLLPTHSNGSEDTFLLISKPGDWYIWSGILSSLTAAVRGKTGSPLPMTSACRPEPDGPAESLVVTQMDCGVSLG